MWSKRRLRRGARNSPFRLCIQLSIKDMKFDWHAEKAANNLSKHGIDFEDAIGIFEGPVLGRVDLMRSAGLRSAGSPTGRSPSSTR